MTEQPRNFRDLPAWREAYEWTQAVYAFTADLKREDVQGLAMQLRVSAASIAANIAEGFRRRGSSGKARFMNLAESSIEESRRYLGLVKELGYDEADRLMRSLEETSRLFRAYARPGSRSVQFRRLRRSRDLPVFLLRFGGQQNPKRVDA